MKEKEELFSAGTVETFKREEKVGFEPGKAQTVICKLYGIGRVFENVKNSVTLIHGPKGCANYLQIEALCISRSLYPAILSTNVTESDIILGTEDILRRAIREAADIYKPDLIAVLTTCATDIIGEDYSAVINEMQDEVDCKLLYKPGGGFIAAYDQGYYDGYEMLVNGVMEAPTKKKKSYVNLLGDLRPGGSDNLELRRLIEAIGLKFNYNIVAGSTVEEIRTSQEAELNIGKCNPTSDRIGQLIESKFGTPHLSPPNPVGIRQTKQWLMQLAEFFGREKEAKKFIEKEMAELNPIIDRVRRKVGGKKVAIMCGPGKLPGLTTLFLELDMEPTLCFSHTYTEAVDRELRTICDEYGVHPRVEWEWSNLYILDKVLSAVNVDFLVGSDVEKGFAYSKGLADTCIMCYGMPLFGFRGMNKFSRHVEHILADPVRKLARRVCEGEHKKWKSDTGFGGSR